MNKTEYIVYWISELSDTASYYWTDNMTEALDFMQFLRKDPRHRFVTMASESVENVGKMGVDAVVDGKCPDGGDFLGRLSRHGMMLKRGR